MDQINILIMIKYKQLKNNNIQLKIIKKIIKLMLFIKNYNLIHWIVKILIIVALSVKYFDLLRIIIKKFIIEINQLNILLGKYRNKMENCWFFLLNEIASFIFFKL